jgi:hypothetical protein
MTGKREQDVSDNKLSLRQAVLHSGGRLLKTYDYGKTFEVVETLSENELCAKGVRLDYSHPAWHRKLKGRHEKRKRREARERKADRRLKTLRDGAPGGHTDI